MTATADTIVPDAGDALLVGLVADAYRDAALQGAHMHKVADALEAIRASVPPTSHFDAWAAIDEQIGLADEATLERVLIGLRQGFAAEVIGRELARLERAFETDPHAGWLQWLDSYSAALDRWRWPLVTAISEAELPFPADAAADAAAIRRWTRLGVRDRWPEANGLLMYLAECGHLPDERRASMYVAAAQLQLYHLLLPDAARPLLERAEKLAPDAVNVALGWAEYALQRAGYDEVRRRCEEVLQTHPDEAAAHNLLGQAFEREDELETAERWYGEATKAKSGESSAYVNLLRLYGRTELFASHEARLPSLLDRTIAVDPDREYNAYIEMGIVYQQNARYEEAHAWYDRAVELDPGHISAHVQKGYASIDEGDNAAAEASFLKAVELADDAFDGHWGLAGLYEPEERWDEALASLRKSLDRRPEWRSSILCRTGAILISLERYDEAEQELLEALELEPESDSATSSVERLVAVCYDDASRTDASLRILGEMRKLKPPAYEPTYWNWVGNVTGYFERHEEAIAAYDRAIELNPDEPVFRSNLAGVWERRRQPGARQEELAKAIALMRRARELDPTDPDYAPKLSTLLNEQTVVRVSGEHALELRWVPPLRIDVSAELLPAVLDAETGDLSSTTLDLIERMRESIKASMGILVPGIRFRELGDSDRGAVYVIAIRGTALPEEVVQSAKYFCPPPLEQLARLGIPAEVHPQTLLGAWIDETHRHAAEEDGVPVWSPLQYMLNHLESVLRSQLEEFVDHRQVLGLLGGLEVGAEIAQSPSLLTELVVALRALVRERIPVVALDAICRQFLALTDEGLPRDRVVEQLRALPELAATLPGNEPGVRLHPLDPGLEADLRRAVVRDGTRPVLALPRGRRAEEIVREAKPVRGERVSLAAEDPELRPFVSSLLESYRDISVIARTELVPERAAQLVQEVSAR